MSKMKLKPGVIAGSALQELFGYLKSVEVRAAGRERDRLHHDRGGPRSSP